LIEVHQRKQIVFMAGAEGQEDSYWRELGYKLALEKHHIPCDPAHIVMGGFSRHIAAESMKTCSQQVCPSMQFSLAMTRRRSV
jgi:DNA-binding LacI/PurR family transcriptional regulator